jgi:hypothetical protein
MTVLGDHGRALPRVAAALLVVLLLAVAGCGNKTKVVTETNSQGQATTRTVPSVRFAKTKFLLHGALAYGAFHRYIYKPFRAGAFKQGAQGRVKALAKAGATGLFTVHELKQMRREALSDDRLRPIADRIGNLPGTLAALAAGFKAGSVPGGIGGVKNAFDGIVGAAKGAGASIPLDKVPNVGG